MKDSRLLYRIIKARLNTNTMNIAVGEALLVLLLVVKILRWVNWEENRVEDVCYEGSIIVGYWRRCKVIAHADVRKYPKIKPQQKYLERSMICQKASIISF